MTAARRSGTPDFSATLDTIRAASVQAELQRRLPREELDALARSGFTSMRVPAEFGGTGATLAEFFGQLVELAAANSNLAQILRQHFFQVELAVMRHRKHPGDASRAALAAIVAGELLGAATTEPQGAVIGQPATRVSATGTPGQYRLDGAKVYTTGALFAQRVAVAAVDNAGHPVTVNVPTARAGVSIHDDWDGFGQRLTATGSARFEAVEVAEDEIHHGWPPPQHGAGFHQLVLLATLAGITAAAGDDVEQIIRGKERVYFTGTGQLPRHDAIVQELVGRLRSTRLATLALVEHCARGLANAWSGWESPAHDEDLTRQAFKQAELSIYTAQISVTELALWATSHALDTLGASSLDRSLAFDRHWRNARTVASHNPHPFKARLVGDHLLNGTGIPAFRPGHDVGHLPHPAES